MSKNQEDLHVFFLPYISSGHLIPMIDLAVLFSDHGVKSTIVTTPLAARRIQTTVDRANERQGLNHKIRTIRIPFPSWTGSFEANTVSGTAALPHNFHILIESLRQPFEELLAEYRPDCVVSDSFFTWSLESASQIGIPRLVFRGLGAFVLKVMEQIVDFRPHDGIGDGDDEVFVIPGLRHRIEMKKSQIPTLILSPQTPIKQLYRSVLESYGEVSNTFEDLEKDHVAGGEEEGDPVVRKKWHIGPLCLSYKHEDEMKARGDVVDDSNGVDCLRWLDSKKPNSVLFVCFGSCGKFTADQLKEMAAGLDSCGHPFLWVVKDAGDHGVPERKTHENGLIIVGWAPQMLILNHKSVGCFMTHCGWNSCLETITAGLPMVIWPLFAEQFINEKFVVDVLRTGVAVKGVGGGLRCSENEEERGFVRRSEIVKAVDSVMSGGDEANEMRKRAEVYGAMAIRAVKEGGTSYNNMRSLIKELTKLKMEKNENNTKKELKGIVKV